MNVKNIPPTPARASAATTRAQQKPAQPRPQLPNGAVIAPSNGSPITGADRARPDAAYDQLPADLKSVMAKSFDWPADRWSKLPTSSRQHLVAVYNRMQKHGLWKHVDRITKIVDPERPALGMRVRGSAGSVELKAKRGAKLLTEVLKNGKFGLDPKLLSLLHPGQKSLREVSKTDGLHISIGKHGNFDAHMDRFSPTVTPDRKGGTRIDGRRSVKHWQQEVLPEMIRKYVKIPGVELNIGPGMASKSLPHPDPNHKGLPIGLPKILGSAQVVLRTPAADRRSTLGTRPTPGTSDVDAAMIKRVANSVRLYRSDALAAPSGAVKDAMEPADFATAIATRFAYAARHGQKTVVIDFKGQYANATPADRRAVARSAADIASTVSAEMARSNPAYGGFKIQVKFTP